MADSTELKQNDSPATSTVDKEEDIRRSKEAGFDFYLTKPVDFHELRTVLAQVGC